VGRKIGTIIVPTLDEILSFTTALFIFNITSVQECYTLPLLSLESTPQISEKEEKSDKFL
jgi:hypothetical protein